MTFILHDGQTFNVPFKTISGRKICKRGTCGRGECVLTSTPPYFECKCKLPFLPPDCRTCEQSFFFFISRQRNPWSFSFLLSCFDLLSVQYTVHRWCNRSIFAAQNFPQTWMVKYTVDGQFVAPIGKLLHPAFKIIFFFNSSLSWNGGRVGGTHANDPTHPAGLVSKIIQIWLPAQHPID